MFLAWLVHTLGIDFTVSYGHWVWYNFWSGFGSDLTEFAIIGSLVVGMRHLNCHVKGCWRVGNHSLEGTPYKLCRKHHPDIPNEAQTHEQILAHYAEVQNAGEESRPVNQEA